MTVEAIGDNGLVAGRYQLASRLGSGGMGIVWQAYDERLHRRVAMKQLLLPAGLSPEEAGEAKRKMMREGRIAARLQHQHTIMVYDVAEHDGQPFLVMEYLPSRSLSEVLVERGRLPVNDVARIGAAVAAALASAHAAGVVHRDVKPGNVLLGDDGQVKITDFGISRAVEDVTATVTGIIAGTPAYLSPEVARGNKATFASDVFSLGATLYAAVEGTPPFGTADNAIALLYRVGTGEIKPPRLAGPLTEVLLALLRAEPEQRPSMQEAADWLAGVAGQTERGARPGDSPGLAALRAAGALPAGRRAGGEPEAQAAYESGEPATPDQAGDRAQRPPATGQDSPAAATAAMTAALPGVPAYPPPAAGHQYPAQAHPQPAAPAGHDEPAGHGQTAPTVSTHPTHVLLPPPGRDAAPAPAKKGGGRNRRLAVLAAAALAVLALAAALLTLWPDPPAERSGNAGAPQATSPAQATTTQAQPPAAQPTRSAATSNPRPATTTPGTATAAPPAAATTPAQAIVDYYALMPGNLTEGWTRLSARYQRSPAGGFEGYQQFWSQMSRVEVSGVSAQSGSTVAATVVYYFKTGKVTEERHSYSMIQEQGRWLIDSHTVISSVSR